MNEKNILSIIDIGNKKKVATPLFSDSVSAGFPSPATDYLEHKLDLNEYLVKHPTATFIVKASGFSMIKEGIHPDDLLIIDRSIVPQNNNIVIASIFGDLTVKKLKKKENAFFLLSANDSYPNIEVKEEMECFIWGVVTFIIHATITR